MTATDLTKRLWAGVGAPGGESSDFDLNPGFRLPETRKLRPAAVLVAVQGDGADASVVLTKRASGLKHHPGQIAFPGGKVDPGDRDSIDAALREAEEEIGLPRDAAEIVGTLPCHETVTGFSVTPVVARIARPFDVVVEAGEVDEVFAAPLNHVLSPANYLIESRLWRGQRRYFYTVPYGPYYIWGATARILRGLADRVAV